MSKLEEYLKKITDDIALQHKNVDAVSKLRELEYELQRYNAIANEKDNILIEDAAAIITKINGIIKDVNALGDFKDDIKRLKEKYGYGK